MRLRLFGILATILIIAVLVGAAIVTFSTHVSQEEIHRQRFNLLNDNVNDDLWAMDTPEEKRIEEPFQKLFAKLDHLVTLDAITRLEVTFKHVADGTPERTSVISALVSNDCPPCLYWKPNLEDGSELFTLLVWCEHSEAAEWRSYLSRLDDAIRDNILREHLKG